MRCAACGTENRTGSKFCDNCGTPLAASCPACGEPNRSDARFCASCGTAFATEASSPSATSTSATGTAAERRLVTVLFTDLVGFTSLAEDRDPEAVRELLSHYFETATTVVNVHGGTVEKFIGDAVMAVWGTPTAHEDDAERAVRAALEIVAAVPTLDQGLQARAGVLTGEAAVTIGATNQGMVAGDLVNTAARLQGVAEASTVLVGEATRRAAERSIVFEPIGEHSLKGKTSPVPAWRAIRVVAQRGGQGRTDALEPPFVGRDEELRQLKEVLHGVGREARPRLVSITGTGGIGKSRLVWELEKYIDGVSKDIYWHRGRSPSYGDGITFWALGEMVRRRAGLTEEDDEALTRQRISETLAEYVPEASERERIGPALLGLLGVDDAPAGGRDALFPAWRTFFERIAARGTTVLVFEDLQWADSGLLDFIDHLLDWSRGVPLMVVTLARPELFDRRPDWGATRRHLTALALEPLTDAAVRELLEGMVPGLPPDALAAIVGRAEGIPLYAVEMVRGLLSDGLIERRGDAYVPAGDVSNLRVPESLRSLIASRLDALPPNDRALIQDASVLGQVFSAEGLGAVLGSDAETLAPRLRDLVRRELLDVETDPRSPERGQLRFVQSLIREIAYGTLGRRERRDRHLAVARHYEAIGDDELAGALASHYVAAHEASDAGPEADAIATQARLALGGAAERAAALGAHQQAVANLDRALALASRPADRAPLLDRAAASAAIAALDEAVEYAERAVAAYRELDDPVAAAHATARLGRTLTDAARITDASAVLEETAPTVEALEDPSAAAAIQAQLSRCFMRLGQSAESIAAADRALEVAERLDLEPLVAEALINKGSSMVQIGRRREGGALLLAAIAIAERVSDAGLQIRARTNYAVALEGDPAASMRATSEAMELAADIGDRGMYFWLLGNVAATLKIAGRGWDEHLVRLREALDQATLVNDRIRLIVLTNLIESQRGERIDEARAEVDELVTPSSSPDAQFGRLMLWADSALTRGDFDASYRHAMEAARVDLQSPETALMTAFFAALGTHDPDRLREVTAMTDELTLSGPGVAAARRLTRAAVAAIEGRPAEAVEGFRVGLAGFIDLDAAFDAEVIAIGALELLPDEPEIRAMAERGRSMLVELRARPWLERLDAALGVGASSATAAPEASASVPAQPPA